MKKILMLVIAIFAFIFNASYGLKFTVQDPQNTWRISNGNIDSAALVVRKAGTYMQFDLTMKMSAKNAYDVSPYKNYDTLEIQYFFEMPSNVTFIDSWLWIGKDLARANLIDRGRGTEIYEGIVKRRRDPSIFYKNSETNYEFRVFPLEGNSYRQVMITWIAPLNWENDRVTVPLNNMILTASNKIPNLDVYIESSIDWVNPRIERTVNSKTVTDNFINQSGFYYFQIPRANMTIPNTLVFNNPMKNGIYTSYYPENSKEGFYQLAILPKIALDLNKGRNIAFIIDFENSQANITKANFLNLIQTQMKSALTPNDSFNIFFSNINTKRFSNDWVKATIENIDSVFTIFKESDLSSYSTLPQLIMNSFNWLKEKKGSGLAFIVSSNDQLGHYKVANEFLADVRILLDTVKVPVYILDFAEVNVYNYYYANRYYLGNQYLYENLSVSTGGEYQLTTAAKFATNFNLLANKTAYQFGAFDFSINMTDGFTYGRYTTDNSTQINDLLSPISIVGRYYGDYPMNLRVTGFNKNQGFSSSTQIEKPNQIYTISKKTWFSNYIKELEKKQQSNQVVNEIILRSIENRILSRNTVFLALETDIIKDNGNGNPTDIDESIKKSDELLNIYPNPATTFANINFGISDVSAIQEIKVIDIYGNLVKSFGINEIQSGMSFKWDLSDFNGNRLPSGTYIIIMKINNQVVTKKIIIL